MSTRYKCPKCGAEALIDKDKKEVIVYPPPLKMPENIDRTKFPTTQSFPSHFDCELGKPVDQIDLKKLVKVEVKK